MDWTQSLTVILTIITSMVAVWSAFYQIVKRLKKNREEFSKVPALWADLLKKTYEIKLD